MRSIPAVAEILEHPAVTALDGLPRPVIVQAVRMVVDELRRSVMAGGQVAGVEAIAAAAAARARDRSRPGTARAVNATGVILHTGLGRAPLGADAVRAVQEAAGYCLLEVDPATGDRHHRESRIAERLVRLTGAEAATVVNNNAGAVLISLAALARGGEVIVSRGELIEIGGSFRIPDVMKESGCRLVEVGATNRCHLHDYEAAITEHTRALLKVWPSNYRVIGFHKEVHAEELVALGREHGLPVMEDLGSGAIVDLRGHGFDEPPVSRSVEAGVDLLTFSGDKLLGAPQAGLIVGRGELVDAVRRHPLFRALRPDKLCLAGLDATLALLERGDVALEQIPVLAMMTEGADEVRARATGLADALRAALPAGVGIEVCESAGRLGSGALPEHDVPSSSVVLDVPDVQGLHERLRLGDPSVFARVKDGRLWLDARTARAPDDLADLRRRLAEELGA